MLVYISGKIKGLDMDVSQKLFKEAETYLSGFNYDIVNSWDIIHDSDSWDDMILKDLEILKTCDAIFMLDNWKDSMGATVEYYFAKGSNKIIINEII